MKKISSIFVVLVLIFLLPISANAAFYEIGTNNMSLEIDDSSWYVFTTSNIYNNPEAEELGLSPDDLHDFWVANDIYLDAILFYENSDASLELFARIRPIDESTNLSDYDDQEVLDLAGELAKKVNCTKFSIHKARYKFMKLEYYSEGYYVMEYSTVVDGDDYLLTFQTNEPFSDWEYEEMEAIVNSIRFDRDVPQYYISQKQPESTPITEPVSETVATTGPLTVATRPLDVIATFAPITIIALVVIFIVRARKKKKHQTVSNIPININCGDVPENYTIIKRFFGTDDLSTIKRYVKEEITDTAAKFKLTRKTDLMQAVFSEMSRQLGNRTSVDRDLLITSYYQLVFDEILIMTEDMNDFMFVYASTKVSGSIDPNMHNFLQMLIRIQLILDETLKLSSQKRNPDIKTQKE